MALETMRVRLTGITPLIMMSARLMDSMDPVTRLHKELTGAVTKTDEITERIKRVEWEASLYLDDAGVVVMPTANICAALREGSKQTKHGKSVDRGVFFYDTEVPLRHPDEGKGMDALYEAGAYLYTRVVQSRKGIMKCRPMFRRWWLEAEVHYQSAQLNRGALLKGFEDAGEVSGLGCWRPSAPKGGPYGRFNVELLACSEIEKPQEPVVEKPLSQNGKPRSRRSAAAQEVVS